tara:strand:+ start:301 stop:525 length:225 start_codon:yes stop_codon:yes gene_type:complete
MTMLKINRDSALELLELYNQAKSEGRDQFVFMDSDILTSYARYMLLHIQNQGLLNKDEYLFDNTGVQTVNNRST